MNQLNEAINRYGENKEKESKLKKLLEQDNKTIKEQLKSGTHDTGDFVATIKEITSEDFDNDKLVAKLKQIWAEEHGSMTNPYLKITFTPNMEAIEDAIYNNELDPLELQGCKVTKVTQRLTIKRSKS